MAPEPTDLDPSEGVDAPPPVPEWIADLRRRTPKGWYGLDAPKGWYPLIERLHAAIVERFPDYEVHQIKEKFGTLRYYCSVDGNDEVFALITAAEAESARTCQKCGAEATTNNTGGWYATLCVSCAARARYRT